jgi:DNA primase
LIRCKTEMPHRRGIHHAPSTILCYLMSKSLGYIDIAAVKAAVSLQQILEHYGVLETLNPSGAGLRGCCPIHNGNDPKQFSVSLERGIWKCFSECAHGGSNLDFVMHKENCNSQEAAWLLNGWFNLGHEHRAAERVKSERPEKPAWKRPSPQSASSKSPPQPATAAPPSSPPPKDKEPAEETGENEVLSFKLDNLDGSHPYLAERGLSAETIAHFGVGYCLKGIMAGRIAIPIHNADGQIVANAGRWPGTPEEGKEKYRLPGKFKKTLEVFNYHRAALEPDTSPLVIVEGFFGVMHLWQLGIRRAVAFMGWHMSARHEELIAKLVTPESRIVLILDHDEAGDAAREKIAPRLAEHCFVRSFRWPEGCQQPDELLPEHLESFIP